MSVDFGRELSQEERDFIEYERREEYRREALEAEHEREYARDCYFISDQEEADQLEKRYGCSLEELGEGELLEIVEEQTGIDAESAEYDSRFDSIDYSYIVEEEEY